MVLLEHTMPDGSAHFDWMLQSDDGRPGLVTFRVTSRVDQPSVQRFEAVRIGRHREAYLTYEGPISGGRGSVRRVAAGICRVLEETADRVGVEARFEYGPPRRWVGELHGGDLWRFRLWDGV
jgi:hypothetical protein